MTFFERRCIEKPIQQLQLWETEEVVETSVEPLTYISGMLPHIFQKDGFPRSALQIGRLLRTKEG